MTIDRPLHFNRHSSFSWVYTCISLCLPLTKWTFSTVCSLGMEWHFKNWEYRFHMFPVFQVVNLDPAAASPCKETPAGECIHNLPDWPSTCEPGSPALLNWAPSILSRIFHYTSLSLTTVLGAQDWLGVGSLEFHSLWAHTHTRCTEYAYHRQRLVRGNEGVVWPLYTWPPFGCGKAVCCQTVHNSQWRQIILTASHCEGTGWWCVLLWPTLLPVQLPAGSCRLSQYICWFNFACVAVNWRKCEPYKSACTVSLCLWISVISYGWAVRCV